MKYYHEGKSYRQIAQLARISVRDIKPILEKYGADKAVEYSDTDGEIVDSDSLMPISSRAYKLFSEFLTPLDVATTLHIDASETIRYYNEFLQLNNRGILTKLFKELSEEEISWVLRLCAIAKTKKMSINQIIECVSIYDEDLPMIKQLHEDANTDLEAVQKQAFQCENRVEYLNHISDNLADDIKSKKTACEEIDNKRRKLIGQTLRLRHFESEFKDNNKTYRIMGQFVNEYIDRLLRRDDNMKLLELSLIAVLRTLGNDQRYRYLLHKLNLVEVPGSFDTNTIINTSPRIGSNILVMKNKNPQNAADHYYHSNLTKKDDNCPACFESSILDMSNKYFEILKQLIADKIMSALIEERAYSSSKYLY